MAATYNLLPGVVWLHPTFHREQQPKSSVAGARWLLNGAKFNFPFPWKFCDEFSAEEKIGLRLGSRGGESRGTLLFKRFSRDCDVRQRFRSREMCLMMQEAKKPGTNLDGTTLVSSPNGTIMNNYEFEFFSAIVFSLANQKI